MSETVTNNGVAITPTPVVTEAPVTGTGSGIVAEIKAKIEKFAEELGVEARYIYEIVRKHL